MNYDLNQWAAQGMIDPYNAGKLIAKQATLVQIADVLKQKTVKDTMLARVTEHLSLWLDQRSKNRLVYDGTWGGVISCGCTYTWNELKKFAYCANNGTRLECPTLQVSDPAPLSPHGPPDPHGPKSSCCLDTGARGVRLRGS